ncbi:MAG: MFS transporter [Candidatus Solibacter usitatus]|nr:MFS transporter [Candidatus Solibacter usitatus]
MNHSANVGRFRWCICGLLFFATTVNYIDRQVLGLLKPVLEKELHWNEEEYGWIVFAFQLAYALMMPVAGRLIDALGTRLGYMAAVVVWSIAAMGHALAANAMQFSIARFALGIGEAANFPAAIKTVADWFPRSERALATGIFNSGTNIGAILAPLAVPYLAATYGWQSAFLVTGATGFIWVIVWMWLYWQPEQHPRLSRQELQYIRSSDDAGEETARVSYAELLRSRGAWAFLLGKFLTDPVWWFYLYWLPGWLNRAYHLDLTQLGLPIIIVYQASTVGSIGGGWIAARFLKLGWNLNRARKTTMLIFALTVSAVIWIPQASGSLWLAVALVSMAAAGHQGWSANLFTLSSDMFPRRMVGAVVGLGGMGGAFGGMLIAPAIGKWLDYSNNAYGPLFVISGCIYLIALLVIHLLVPDIEKTAQ